jgi:hypothetical protein
MSFSFLQRGYCDPTLLAGIDPMAGLIPFDPPALPPPSPRLDPNALLAALGPPPPGLPTNPDALMALLANPSPGAQRGGAGETVQLAAIGDNPPAPPATTREHGGTASGTAENRC